MFNLFFFNLINPDARFMTYYYSIMLKNHYSINNNIKKYLITKLWWRICLNFIHIHIILALIFRKNVGVQGNPK